MANTRTKHKQRSGYDDDLKSRVLDGAGYLRARTAAGLSRAEAAAGLGVSESALAAWESTRPQAVTAQKALAMCRLYGCDANQLFGWDRREDDES